ncbi:hypothetical protein, partial [Thauera aromatica]|uniref:hypothetical protein n=1 Tax=Thauera aromatica TaxID=59405 RepID=UPI001FFCD134
TPPVIVTGRRFHLPIALCGPSRYVTTGTSNRVITLTRRQRRELRQLHPARMRNAPMHKTFPP